jgi:DNA-binding CsgD family transcriptional regulator
MGEVQAILTPLWGLAETDLLTGDVESAIARSEEAWSIAEAAGERALFIPFVVTGTRSMIAAARADDAERWLTRAREHLAGWESVAGPAIAHAEGLIRMAGGSIAAAREGLERAVRGWDERGRVWESTWARLDLAQCLVRMNRHADAVALVADVRATATALGSGPLLARTDELAKASRGRAFEEEPWRPLTVREFEVARLIAEGLTNSEIALRLDIAPKTVSAHVEHILAKLGAARRAEVASWVATTLARTRNGHAHADAERAPVSATTHA